MLPNHADADRAHHDLVADHYDELVNVPRDVLSSLNFGRASRYLPERGRAMLDLGAGTGHMSVRFGARFDRIVLVDHSSGMLGRARVNLGALAGRADLIHADILQYAHHCRERFDLISCVGVLHHLDRADLDDVLGDVVRCLDDDGALLIAEPVQITAPEPRLARMWNAPVLPRLSRYLELAPPPEEHMLDLEDMRALLNKHRLDPIFERRAWELYSRFGGGLIDRMAIALIDTFIHADGLIWFAVVRRRK